MAREDAYLIDPPVGPFSPLEELKEWRQELRQMPESQARDDALEEVEEWISEQENE